MGLLTKAKPMGELVEGVVTVPQLVLSLNLRQEQGRAVVPGNGVFGNLRC